MSQLLVNNTPYRIEFRHISKHGKRAQLHKGSVQAVTTCVVMAENFIAIDNALCVEGDVFSRREGRMRALNKVLDHCAPLRKIKSDFFNEYVKIDPDPKPVLRRERLSQEKVAELKACGQEGKALRRNRRKEARRMQRNVRANAAL